MLFGLRIGWKYCQIDFLPTSQLSLWYQINWNHSNNKNLFYVYTNHLFLVIWCKITTGNRDSGCCPTSTCHIVNIHSITWSCWIVSISKEDKFTWRSWCKPITTFWCWKTTSDNKWRRKKINSVVVFLHPWNSV
jgi:hypothetical protein